MSWYQLSESERESLFKQKLQDPMNVFPICALTTNDDKNRCANCGKPMEEAKSIIISASMYDGEWCCCEECSDEHDMLGCPFESGILFRDMKY